MGSTSPSTVSSPSSPTRCASAWRTPPQGRSSAECAHICSPSNGLCPTCPPLEKSLRLSVPSSPLRGKRRRSEEDLTCRGFSRILATLCATTSAKSNAHWRNLFTTGRLIFRVHLGFSSLSEFCKLCFRINQTVQQK